MKMLMRSSIVWGWITVGLVAMAATTFAQDAGQVSDDESVVATEEETPSRKWGFSLEAAAWFSQPVGTDYVLSSAASASDPYATTVLAPSFGTDDRLRWRVGYRWADRGVIEVTYWSQAERGAFSAFSPGNFVFGEQLAFPLYAGLNDDGLADAVTADTGTATRDLKVEFVKQAFQGHRVSLRWSAGLRSVDHSRNVDTRYWALLPGLPALIEPGGTPRPDLNPLPDRVTTESFFSGRGPSVGIEIDYEMAKKFSVEFGLSAAVLRGSTDARYVSTTHYYDVPSGEGFEPVSPEDYQSVFSDPDLISFVQQRDLPAGLVEQGRSASATVIDAHLGFRWTAWRSFDVVGGFRASRYGDIVREVRVPTPVESPNGAVNLQGIERRDQPLGYEGFYLGLAYTY